MSPGLQTIDSALMAKLAEAGNSDLPSQVCVSCFSQLAGSVARGSVLLAKEKAREQRKVMLWKSRVSLIKKARALMQDKAYSEAAVHYEKYLRVLEVVFDTKPGELAPEHFKDSARTAELTVVASAYWDLMRIYDTSERYGDRMQAAAKKLGIFLRFTPIFPDIMKKAEAFSKTCRNQVVVKNFIKSASETKSGCFVATAAFDSTEAPEVECLRQWRDRSLLPNFWGHQFVRFYYLISPSLAGALNRFPHFKPAVRAGLRMWIHLAVRQSRLNLPSSGRLSEIRKDEQCSKKVSDL